MLTDVKIWLETTDMKVAEERFVKPPELPYVIFLDGVDVRGADNKNFIAERNISIELYSEKIDHDAEEKIETLLNEKPIEFKKNRTWIDTERLYQTVYDFNLVEKL